MNRVLIRGITPSNLGAQLMGEVAAMKLQQRLSVQTTCCAYQSIMQPFQGVVDVSGYAYGEVPWSKTATESALKQQQMSPRTPWVFMPQSFGPFRPEQMRTKVRQLIAGRQVMARDQESHEHLLSLAAPGVKIMTCPDIVFAGPEGDRDQGWDILTSHGLRRDVPLVGCIPNLRAAERFPHHLAQWKRVIDHLRQQGCQVVLLPHQICGSGYDDRKLFDQLPADAKLLAMYDGRTIRSVIGCLHLLVSGRYHGLVTALRQRVPVVAIGWAHKYRHLLADFELEAFCVSGDAEPNTVISKLQECLDQQFRIRQQIQQLLPDIQQRAEQAFDLAAQVLRSGGMPQQPTHEFPMLRSLRAGVAAGRVDRGSEFELRRNLHRLEKGLAAHAVASTARAFGADYILATVLAYKELLHRSRTNAGGGLETVQWGRQVLEQYFRTVHRSPTIDAAAQMFREQEQSAIHPPDCVPRFSERVDSPAVSHESLRKLISQRCSVRRFLPQSVPAALIRELADAMLQGPSACNRQAFEIRYYDDPQLVRQIVDIPYGAKGYVIPGVFVFTTRYSGYTLYRDVKCPLIDASLGAMLMMLTAVTLELATLPINFPEEAELDRQIRSLINLHPDEVMILLLGVRPGLRRTFRGPRPGRVLGLRPGSLPGRRRLRLCARRRRSTGRSRCSRRGSGCGN